MSLREWIGKSGIVLRGAKYSTKGHEYLNTIIDDDHPWQIYMKGAQVAMSTTMLIKTLYVAEHLGKKAVYYFQNDGQVSDFSNDRCQTMLDETPYLASRVRSTNNVGLKQIGPGALYLRGLFTLSQVKSIDCDMVITDETDECKEALIDYAVDRMMHSDLQWFASLSQPSFPGYGIDKQFKQTDQRYWNLICPSCGKYNCLELDFPENFLAIPDSKKRTFPDGATHYRGCKSCEAKLQMSQGEWVALRPDRKDKRGYHLSQLYTQIKPPNLPNIATKIMKEWEDYKVGHNKIARFTVSVLGFPYGGGNARVDEKLLDFIEGDHGFSYRETGAYMGVDQGDQLHIAIGIISGSFFKWVHFEETDDWNKLDELMIRFGVSYAVVDAMPNKWPAKQFCSRFPKQASIQYFQGKELKKGTELLSGTLEIPSVSVDRTSSLDSMIDRMEQGLVMLPNRKECRGTNLAALERSRYHCKQLIAKEEMTNSGVMRRVFIGGQGIENHFAMAMNSSLIAAYELGYGAAAPMIVPVFRKFGTA